MHAQPRLALASAAAATLTGGPLTFPAATVTGVVMRGTPHFGANFAG
jgi:hypothetical protein